MNERLPAQLPALQQAIRDAAIRAPKEPPRTMLWPRRLWLRLPMLVLMAGLTVGFTGGSIAIPINVFHPRVDITLAWFLGLAQCLPLILAPRWPLVAWRIHAVGMLWGTMAVGSVNFCPWPVTSLLAALVILFFVAATYERRISFGVLGLTVAGLILPAVLIATMPGWFGIILTGVTILALAFGDAVGGRYTAELSLAEQAELRRQDLIHQATLEERARIARELHDVVAHHMSVIAMQAEAAPYKIPELPPAARDTFQVVRDAARDALAETRRVVGLLRAGDEDAERAPQPGLDLLDEVVDGARRAGLTVRVSIVGVPRPVPAGVDLSAYRIVQESLSNAARYAPGSSVEVELRYDRAELTVSVRDDGPRTVPAASGGGHGLVGMRERVTMLGGTLLAGPRDGAGWAIVATLPYGDDRDDRGA